MSDDRTPAASDFARSVGDAIQANPLPAALIGAGFVWLLAGGGSSATAGFHAMGVTLTSRGRIHDAAGSIADQRGEDARGSFAVPTPQIFGAARKNIADLLEQQPLLLGAIGLGVGAAVAAAFRPTAIETEMLGAASTTAHARAGEVVNAAAGRATDVIDKVTRAIGDEAITQGLTPEDFKSAARDVGNKVASVVGDSAQRLKAAAAGADVVDSR